jgi:hypothetical protein
MFLKFLPLLFLLKVTSAIGQAHSFPKDILGYNIGEKFTRHYKMVAYFHALQQKFPDKVRVEKYGESYEGRDLILVFISSKNNISSLKEIEQQHFSSNKLEKTAIVWLSYNVHGNESSGTEAAMQTAYELLTNHDPLLENNLIIMDPCLNPDGRERYVNFYYQYAGILPNPNISGLEHHEPWPSGRLNHYLFDLNRDWAWQTQIETQQRMIFFNRWQPHVHVDFHEHHFEDDYYFPPAAAPYHSCITDWQINFQEQIGKNHSQYFDERNWKHFSREIYDLLYPSYGDTYPSFNGAIGMTYEQGGSGRAGLSIIMSSEDTLTLSQRVAHHTQAGISTIEVSNRNVSKLIAEQKRFFKNRVGLYKTYLLKEDANRQDLLEFLDKQGIEYQYAKPGKNINCLNYSKGQTENYQTKESDIYITANQKKSTLIQVLMEPQTFLSDSLTYDVTAWSLPYAYGVPTCASKNELEAAIVVPVNKKITLPDFSGQYAIGFPWEQFNDAKALSYLLSENWKIHTVQKPFTDQGRWIKTGTVLLFFKENMDKDVGSLLQKMVENFKISPLILSSEMEKLTETETLWNEVIPAKTALITGENTDPLTVGEVWFFMEQQLNYPLTLVSSKDWLEKINYFETLIFADYLTADSIEWKESLQTFIQNGGKVILLGSTSLESMAKAFFSDSIYNFKTHEKKEDITPRMKISSTINGAIFNTQLNIVHPLTFGIDEYFTQRKDNLSIFSKQMEAIQIPYNSQSLAGFMGYDVRSQAQGSVVAASQKIGKGQVILFTDNPLFRGQWHNGKLLFSNALFQLK